MVTPLHLLLEASFIPERLRSKAPALPKVQSDEMLDALDNRAVPWSQLLWEWAVEDGQVDLTIATRLELDEGHDVCRDGFNEAMIEIQCKCN